MTPGNVMFRLRDRKISDRIVSKLKSMKLDIRLMHVCGTHQDTLIRHGLDSLLSDCGVEIRQGPGCPVCVTTTREIEECLLLARNGIKIMVYGDMLKVPGTSGSLSSLRADGADVNVVYGIGDAVTAASKTKNDVVFMGIGFETTAPSTAATIFSSPPDNFAVLCCHRTIPNALRAIVEMGEVKLDGLIEPGHVSAIIGAKPYEFLSREYGIPQVIAGFEPLDLMMGVYMLAKQIEKGEAKVENEYSRVVDYSGNKIAQGMLEKVFEPCDVEWRGFPMIPGSGLAIRKKYGKYDARRKYESELSDVRKMNFSEPRGCRCGDVLRGLINSDECPLFGRKCTPFSPLGPCMVSAEGSCSIMYKYSRSSK